MAVYFENTKRNIIMTEKGEEVIAFVKKILIAIKLEFIVI